MSRSATNTATATYKIKPSDHAKTAVIAKKFRASSSTGSSVAAKTATDCAPTIRTNHRPFAALVIGRSDLPSTATTGITYPKTSQLTPATPSRIDAVVHQPENASLVPRTPVPDRKSTRLNSSHVAISYADFCLKKKKTE